jgi:hypothetical protein
MAHRTIFPLLGEGGSGSTAWGQITGNLNSQTDLKNALDLKVDISSLATVATSGDYNDLSNKPSIPAAQVQANWNEIDTTSPAYIVGKPTIPTVNDSTITFEDSEGTTIDSFTLNQSSNKTITIPSSGGGSNQWYGTQLQFDALGTYDDDTDYYISDKLDYNTELKNKPDLTVYATKTEVNTKNDQQDTEIAGKLSGVFMTQQEFDQSTPVEGQNYFIEGQTVEMVVTFTDQTTATYNVVVD